MKNNSQSAVEWLRSLAALGMFCGLFSSSALWTNFGRTLPACPLIELPGGDLVPGIIDPIFFVIALVLSALLVFKKAGIATFGALFASLFLLVLRDLNRFQPWLYEYLLIISFCLAPLSPGETAEDRKAHSLQAVSILLISMYFFSGLQKINWRFLTAIGPWLIGHPAENADSYSHDLPMIFTSASMILWEVAAALALCWKRTRISGLVMVLVMHSAILYMLGPSKLNTNAAVWPWNFTQMALLTICFLNCPDAPLFKLNLKEMPIKVAILAVVSLAVPVLGLLQIADPYPAWALYTGDVPWGSLLIEKSTVEKLPAETAAICKEDESTGLWSLGMNDWAYLETGAALYSSEFCIRKVAERFARDHKGELVVLRIQTYPKLTRDAPSREERLSSKKPDTAGP